MNAHLLIDAIVRQTTVLVAHLATAGGARAALGHTANQVFLELAGELRRQGLNNKLIADLFGLSLRTYHNKMRRLSESATDRGRPLWNAVLDFVQAQGTVTRAEVLMRFCRDDDATVKSVLNDLVEAGLVFGKGRGDDLAYRAASAAEVTLGARANVRESREHLVWILVARHSPATKEQLVEWSQLEPSDVDRALESLEEQGRVARRGGPDDSYESRECVLAVGQASGWEAGVFDHYQAMVSALCAKLALGAASAERGEQIGGSTYSVEVWPGHPCFEEAVGLLQEFRKHASALRARVDEHNQNHDRPTSGVCRVVTYVGQNVTDTSDSTENPA